MGINNKSILNSSIVIIFSNLATLISNLVNVVDDVTDMKKYR